MVICLCGELIINEIGEGFVVTVDDEQRWMRRRSDSFVCQGCRRTYVLNTLRTMASPITERQEQSALG